MSVCMGDFYKIFTYFDKKGFALSQIIKVSSLELSTVELLLFIQNTARFLLGPNPAGDSSQPACTYPVSKR